jgi:hypothetical protein
LEEFLMPSIWGGGGGGEGGVAVSALALSRRSGETEGRNREGLAASERGGVSKEVLLSLDLMLPRLLCTTTLLLLLLLALFVALLLLLLRGALNQSNCSNSTAVARALKSFEDNPHHQQQ